MKITLFKEIILTSSKTFTIKITYKKKKRHFPLMNRGNLINIKILEHTIIGINLIEVDIKNQIMMMNNKIFSRLTDQIMITSK